jgi:phosphate transport system protein
MDGHKRRFDEELGELKKHLLHMAALVENMIDIAIRALKERDENASGKVRESENEVNRLQLVIDEEALRLLALRQPVAMDLRFILTATRINSDLERIGDLAVNIMENVHTLCQQPQLKPLIDIPNMAGLSRKMLRESLDSFVEEDVVLAQGVIMSDDKVDDLKDQVFRELLTYMMADPKTIERALALLLISRHLERIGDHAVNIAEESIYLIQGRDVRHPKIPREREHDSQEDA